MFSYLAVPASSRQKTDDLKHVSVKNLGEKYQCFKRHMFTIRSILPRKYHVLLIRAIQGF